MNPAILIRGLVGGRFRLPSWLRCAPERDSASPPVDAELTARLLVEPGLLAKLEFGHGSVGIAVRDQLAGHLGLSLLTGKTRPAPVMN